ncbi:hypothetical protein PG997_001606 [Apiospora hydei]|uniref:Glucose-methanol-choline oxidoreductase C-terminal domain-containing protein n=1 Tax=Apiospora hydei TaxID=1337664 RepID=A0ABR1XE74_9PEZI
MASKGSGPVTETDAVVVGLGPVGTTYDRKLVDAGIAVHMIEIKDDTIQGGGGSRIANQQSGLGSFNVSNHLGQVAIDDISSPWTFSASRRHPKLERCSLFNGDEWDTLYAEAEKRLRISSTAFDGSIRHQLVKRTLQAADHDGGARELVSMPLPVARNGSGEEGDLEWTRAATVLPQLDTEANGSVANGLLTLHRQTRLTKLVRGDLSGGGRVESALCRDFETDKGFLIKAEIYVICAGALSTPGILHGSGWKTDADGLPALPVASWVLSRDLVNTVPKDPYHLGWNEMAEKHKRENFDDAIPIPLKDLGPHVGAPASERYPWHAEIYRNDDATTPTAEAVDRRMAVDLRWSTYAPSSASGGKGRLAYSDEMTDIYGMPGPIIELQPSSEEADVRRAQDMIQDMCSVASKLGGMLRHATGTTRAGTSRDDSVCDKYGRVWGTDNVVVGGCNVVPAGSACDPTLTAVCFAIAGADKIIEKLAPKAAVAGKN